MRNSQLFIFDLLCFARLLGTGCAKEESITPGVNSQMDTRGTLVQTNVTIYRLSDNELVRCAIFVFRSFYYTSFGKGCWK